MKSGVIDKEKVRDNKGAKMLKILITLKDITEQGGGERVGVNLANALAKSSLNVCVASFFKAGEKPFYALDERV